MKYELRRGRWTITFIKVRKQNYDWIVEANRKGYFYRTFKIDKQKGSMVFLISICIGRISIYIRRGWYPVCILKSRKELL